MARLSLTDVSYWHPGSGRPALERVSLAVAPGEVVAVVGRVGAGASTLLLVAADLAPRVVGGRLEGSVQREGTNAIVLPTPWTQVSGMAFTVRDEVAFGPANLGRAFNHIQAAVDRAIEQVGIRHLARREPATLSGGELQRVILAGALAMEPDLLLLDEPTAELDPEGARSLWVLLRALAREDGMSVLVASSDLDALPGSVDRVVWLDQGGVRRIGTCDELLGADEIWKSGPGGTSVGGVWRAAGCPGPLPLTVADAMARTR
jgi:energy-coupling factor transporter ATP-binding protein EcfA2